MDGVIDEFTEEYEKPKPMSFEDYRGMSKDSEIDYQRRQAEPMFKSAKQLTPMNQLARHYENLECGNKKKGCIIPKNHAVMAWCPVCTMLMAMGTNFFEYEGKLTEEMVWKMTEWQRAAWQSKREYWNSWLDNYPRGAMG